MGAADPLGPVPAAAGTARPAGASTAADDEAADAGALAARAWADALRVAALIAVDPWGFGGAVVKAGHGPVRERFLTVLKSLMPMGSPWRRVPVHAGDDRLLGGLDLTATLAAGRPVAQTGLLAEADGGVLVLAMAERASGTTSSRLCAALDSGECVLARDGLASVRPARFGVVALDEGTGDDPPPAAALLERLAFRLDLADVPVSIVAAFDGDARALLGPPSGAGDAVAEPDARAVAAARARLAAVTVDDETLRALCGTAAALGVDSARGALMALRAARAAAALDGRDAVCADDAALAARLVLAPRATRWPSPPQEPPAEPPPPPGSEDPPPEPQASSDDAPPPDACDDGPPPDPGQPLDEVVLEAAKAAIPADLLAGLMLAANAGSAGGGGRAGAMRASTLRGRPMGARPGTPRDGARLALVDTLRAAAPWQPLRRREAELRASRSAAPAPAAPARKAPLLSLRTSDLRVSRLRERTETTTIFAIDASGSSALHRLAEAKGAIELLLADCYVRRDRVAVIAFRGRTAEVLLPPTRSLVRAKRSLAGLPGGGGTPLASAIDAATALAEGVARRGGSPVVVFLTDGRANVARDGSGGRARADQDAQDAARRMRAGGHASLVLDTSPQPAPSARALAASMAATYVPLPRADAASIAAPVRAAAVAGPRAVTGRGR
ncbi:MAG: hypothetical protein RJA99_304 [Pseudomonadota bacterium]|jgi:magnesium chelatase subunit D